MTDDAWIPQQTLDTAARPSGDPVEIEIGEGVSKTLAFSKDREPAESRLESLETQLFEEALIVFDRKAPFGVVVGLIVGMVATPDTASFDDFRHQNA